MQWEPDPASLPSQAAPVEGAALLTPVLRLLLRTLEGAVAAGKTLNPSEQGYLVWLRRLREEDLARERAGYEDGWAASTIIANPPTTGGHSEPFYARHRDTYRAGLDAELRAATNHNYLVDPYLRGYLAGSDRKAEELGYGKGKPVD